MRIFVDTSALFALLDEEDPNHAGAVATWPGLLKGAELVTHNYVHVEATAVIQRRLGRDAAAVLVDRLLPALTTVWVDQFAHTAAVEAWRGGSGGTSLVDHLSFLVMRRIGIYVPFAFDADFEAFGFKRAQAKEARRGPPRSEGHSYERSLKGESDLVGDAEAAARAGHSSRAIQSWRRRHPLSDAVCARTRAGLSGGGHPEAWIRVSPVARPSARQASRRARFRLAFGQRGDRGSIRA